MKFKVGDKIRRISNPVSTCEVVIADPVCALYDIAGIPRAGYAVLYPDGTKSWNDFEYVEREFETDE
jgi:hypothetical protein